VARRPLGATGLEVSPIGFGAFKIGRNQGVKYPTGYALPDEAAVATLLDGVLAAGINYVDTAPAYGLSEERLGVCLAGRDVVLSTKVGETFTDGRSSYDFSAAAVRASIERSRTRLGRRRLDLVFIHAHGDDLGILADTPVVATLQQLQAEGQLGAIGFSGKTVAAAQRALDFAGVLMVEYHLDDRSHAELIAEAARRGIGVVVKKGLASGRLPPADAIDFVLGTPGVSSLVIGGLDLAHICANLAIAERSRPARR
jgi:aryl-alcohol dehydrogenase-like predicted oxidoreductase